MRHVSLWRVGWITVLFFLLIISQSNLAQPLNGAQASVMEAFTGAFQGTWDIRVTAHNLDGTASPTGEGDEIWTFEAGGVPFVERYHSKSSTGDSYDVGFFWWNSVTSTIDGSFCMTSSEQGCTPFHVQWQNNRAVMDGEYLSKGKVIVWHELFVFSDRNSFTQTLEIGNAGTELKRVVTIFAKRRN
jgi:hypothetical protein